MNISFKPWEIELSKLLDEKPPDLESRLVALKQKHPDHSAEIQDSVDAEKLVDKYFGPSEPGETLEIPGYILGEILGSGGMGTVIRARDTYLNRDVAIKVIRKGLMSERARKRFMSEARTTIALHHPGIVPVYEAKEIDGTPYIVMALLEGRALDYYLSHVTTGTMDSSGKLQDAGRMLQKEMRHLLPAHGVAQIGQQVSSALAYSHEAGVVHRDVKPANLILKPDGQVVLTDFGLSRHIGDLADDEKSEAHEDLEADSPPDQIILLSQTKGFVGTPPYMAPELLLNEGRSPARGEAESPATETTIDEDDTSATSGEQGGRKTDLPVTADIYSLGVTLYQLLTDQLPYPGKTVGELKESLREKTPPSPRELVPSIPLELEAIVLKAMEKDPANRYATAREMEEDFQRFLEGKPVLAPLRTTSERIRRFLRQHRVAILAVAAAIVISSVALYQYLHLPGMLQIQLAEGDVVRIDGKRIPHESLANGHPLPAGEYELDFEVKGKFHETESLEIQRGKTIQRKTELLPSELGVLDVITRPPGASVTVTRIPDGNSNLEAPSEVFHGISTRRWHLLHGSYRVEIELEGHSPWKDQVTIQPGNVLTEVNQDLEDLRPRLQITSSIRQKLDLEIRDRDTPGKQREEALLTGQGEIRLAEGTYDIIARAQHHYPVARLAVEIGLDKKPPLHFNLNPRDALWSPNIQYPTHRGLQAWTPVLSERSFIVVAGEHGEVHFLDLENQSRNFTWTLADLLPESLEGESGLPQPPWHEPRVVQREDGKAYLVCGLSRRLPEEERTAHHVSIYQIDMSWITPRLGNRIEHREVELHIDEGKARQSFPYLAFFKLADERGILQEAVGILETRRFSVIRLLDGEVLWDWPFPANVARHVPDRLITISSPDPSESQIALLPCADGAIVALDVRQRQVAWTSTDLPATVSQKLAAGSRGRGRGSQIYYIARNAAGQHEVLALNAQTGEEAWRHSAGDWRIAQCLVTGDILPGKRSCSTWRRMARRSWSSWTLTVRARSGELQKTPDTSFPRSARAPSSSACSTFRVRGET